MFTEFTFNDYLEVEETGRLNFILNCIEIYKNSNFFKKGLEAEKYFKAENIEINNRKTSRMTKSGKKFTYSKNMTISDFFYRFVLQQNQFLLANGVQLKDHQEKSKLGFGFDKILETMGEKSLVHGVCWGFWNNDRLLDFPAIGDNGNRGFFTLVDEFSGENKLGIRFWQLTENKPMYIEIYDEKGISTYSKVQEGIKQIKPHSPYKRVVKKDKLSEILLREEDYGMLPIVPLYANEYKRSEFKDSIKTKIDIYDKIATDFGDNLERTNDIYWVISNFGGTTDEIKEMLAEIEELRATYTMADGMGNATAQPHTIEVPFEARQTALKILERQLYSDFMALNMEQLTGISLTNVAIRTATANLELKANKYEWQLFQFMQKILALAGIITEDIRFKRQYIANEMETIKMIYLSRKDMTLRKALELNPLIEQDEIDGLVKEIEYKEAEEKLVKEKQEEAKLSALKTNNDIKQEQKELHGSNSVQR